MASALSTSLTTSASRIARSRSGSASATSAPGTANRRTRSAATWSSPAIRRSAGLFGPSALIVGDNHVGRDLVFSNNTAVPGGSLEVSRNVVGRDATCAGNNPAVTVNGPNSAGRSNTCGWLSSARARVRSAFPVPPTWKPPLPGVSVSFRLTLPRVRHARQPRRRRLLTPGLARLSRRIRSDLFSRIEAFALRVA